jgi:hypothetical protein
MDRWINRLFPKNYINLLFPKDILKNKELGDNNVQ